MIFKINRSSGDLKSNVHKFIDLSLLNDSSDAIIKGYFETRALNTPKTPSLLMGHLVVIQYLPKSLYHYRCHYI